MALFNACICRFEKEFDVFVYYVSVASNVCVNQVATFTLTPYFNCRLKQRALQKFTNSTEAGSKLNTIAHGKRVEKNALRPLPSKRSLAINWKTTQKLWTQYNL
jgi:hypothetical protein